VKIPGYAIDLERAVKVIRDKKYKRVIMQIPEGLKIYAGKLVDFLENKSKASIIISADPCYGACDVLSENVIELGADLLIQVGHTPIPVKKKSKTPILFINAHSDADINKNFPKVFSRLIGKNIGIVTTAQDIDKLGHVSKILSENGFKPIIGAGDRRITQGGQVLGCDFSAATSITNLADSLLFIGSGSFHPLGLMLSTNKPVIVFDPYTSQIRTEELNELRDIVLKQRHGAIARARDARLFGIIIGTKIGQQRIELAYELREKLNLKQKKSWVLVSDHLTPSHLEGYRDVDCFVSTACPRIAIDDYMQYKTPILTPVELDILLGYKKWEDYKFDEITS
jgi:2-(3-amino-3-carboxypropyl)histidine synthase